jgi:8-oxo-dGTP pyrophosphatase MutT (NUDIX family)
MRDFLAAVSFWLMRAAHASRYRLRRLLGEKAAIQGVRVILVRDNRVCLVRHWYAPWAWTLPGGGVKRRENVFEAAEREVQEETKLRVRSIEGILGTYTGPMGKGDTVIVVHSRDFDGSLALMPSLEIAERCFFDLAELPHSLSPGNRRRIEEFRSGICMLDRAPW